MRSTDSAFAATTDPYFRATTVGDRVEIAGEPHWSGGHPVEPSKPGGPEDGVFARWSWDGRELVAVNDRYGFHPLFYCARPGSIAISPSVVTLLETGAPRDLDDVAIAAFLRLSSYLGADTPFASIRAVPPGATFRWSAQGLTVSGSYVFRSAEAMTREQALTEYTERFREAVRRRLCPGEEIVHPLSGGRDSRHILLELCDLGAKPSLAVTARPYPPKYRQDIEIASIVARRLGVPHRVLEQEPQAPVEWEKNVDTSLCCDRNGWAIAVKRSLDTRRVCLFDGIAGGILSAGAFLDREGLDLFEAGRFEVLSRRVCRRRRDGLEPFLQLLLSPTAYRRFGPEAGYERIEQELREHANAPNPVSSFYFWNRTRRDIALTPFGIYRRHRVLAPFLDHDVYDLLAALPASLLLDRQFHTDAIRRAHPRYADIPFATERHKRLENRSHYRHFALDLIALAARRGSLGPLRVSRVGPRLLATAVTGRRARWLALVLYLFQLGQIAAAESEGVPLARGA
jgi:asparagine synthase (glutamine-hydrolysing)